MKIQNILESEEAFDDHQWNPATKRVFDYLSKNLEKCFTNVAARPGSVVLHNPVMVNENYSEISISRANSLMPLLVFGLIGNKIILTFFQDGVQTLGNISLGEILSAFGNVKIEPTDKSIQTPYVTFDLSSFVGDIYLSLPGITFTHNQGEPKGKISINNPEYFSSGYIFVSVDEKISKVLELNNFSRQSPLEFRRQHAYLPSGFVKTLTLNLENVGGIRIANDEKLKVETLDFRFVVNGETGANKKVTKLCKSLINLYDQITWEKLCMNTMLDSAATSGPLLEAFSDLMGGLLVLKMANKLKVDLIPALLSNHIVTQALPSNGTPINIMRSKFQNFDAVFDSVLENFEEFSSPEELEEFIQDSLE